MHDAIIGERLSLPSVSVMTAEFAGAAERMSRVLGAEGHRFVVIEHPISSASLEALAGRARRAAVEAAAILTGAR